VEMRNLRTNHALSDNLFTFTPPAGAQVFDQ
jgi:outer membrane lipoprotein-sorting protein